MERWKLMDFSELAIWKAGRALLWKVFNASSQGSRYFCVKLPGTLSMAPFILKFFPNTKFIWLIRDGRAAANAFHTLEG